MSIFAIGPLAVSLLTLVFGIFVYFINKEAKLNRLFLLLSISVFVWSFGYSQMYNTRDNFSIALFWARIGYIGVVFIPVFTYHYIITFLELKRKILTILSVYTLGILFLLVSRTSLFLNSGYTYFWGYYPKAGQVYILFVLFFAWIFLRVIAFLFLSLKSKKAASLHVQVNKIKYVLLGFAFATTSIVDYTQNYGIQIYPWGYLSALGWLICMGWASFRYRLMDINIAITRAGIFIVVYALVLGIPLGLSGWGKIWLQESLGSNWYWAPLIMAIVLATAGPFIFIFLQRRAEKHLRKEQLVYQQALRSISSTMMLNKDLDKLLNSIVLNVVDIVKVEWAAVYLKDDKAQKYFLRHQRSQAQSLIIPAEFTPDSEFIKHLFNSRLPLIGEEFHSGELKVGLAVPCFLDSNMVGFLLLGNKPKGVIYDQSDVNEFTLLANQIALAIENCQFYTKERQQEHSRRLSSLDNQISWMAHEMDNPIHATLSVLGTIDIALDELVGTIPSDKMEYLKQKLSRVEFNAGRVSKMISAVKEFTKPTTGEFIPVTLQQIIASFEAILQPQIRHFGIDFMVNLPAEPVWLRVNKVEIEQVLVNLGTNSVQAINELWQDKRRTTQGEKRMVLTAYKMENKVLRIDLKDTGGGIEDKLLEDIFLDFVTTKASTVGTGLGLAIARKIISRHKGKIWAESQGPGSGATFHIELPVAEDITEEEKTKFSDGQNESKRRDMI